MTGKEGTGSRAPEVFYHQVICSNSQEYSLSEMEAEKAAVGEGGGGWTVGSNEPLEGVSTTASTLGLFTLLNLLKVI